MAVYSLTTGATLVIREVPYKLINKLEDGRLQFRQPTTSELLTVSREEFLSLYASNQVEFEYRGLPTASGANWHDQLGKGAFVALADDYKAVAERRERYVKAVLAAGCMYRNERWLKPIIAAVAGDAAHPDPRPPGWLSVYRWTRRYERAGRDIRSLLDQRGSQGNHKDRVKGPVRELVVQALDEVYLTLERPDFEDTLAHLRILLSQTNKQFPQSKQLLCPSRKYLSKVLHQEYDAYTITERRYGKQAADREFRGAVGRQERPTRPMERVQLDHTLLDVILVDDETFVILGRPDIAVAIDVLTKCVVGFSVGFEHPSASTLAACIRHAILPKYQINATYPAIKNTWDCMGNIETLVLDRALENLGNRIASAGRQNGMDIEYCKRRSGWGKGVVERFFRTLNDDLIHLLPGTTFSNILARADYQSSKHAIITKSAFLELLHTWIIDIYLQSYHRTIHDVPAHKWSMEVAGCPVFLPRSARDLEVAFGTPERQKLWHYGIEINRLRYNNDLMLELRRKIGNEQFVDFMWYEENLGYIDVLDPETKQYIRVRCVDFEYANGLTLYQHTINRDYAKQHFEGREDVFALAEAKARIRAMIKECISHKRGSSHKRMTRYLVGRGLGPSEASESALASKFGVPPQMPESSPATPEEASIGMHRDYALSAETDQPQRHTDNSESEYFDYEVER